MRLSRKTLEAAEAAFFDVTLRELFAFAIIIITSLSSILYHKKRFGRNRPPGGFFLWFHPGQRKKTDTPSVLRKAVAPFISMIQASFGVLFSYKFLPLTRRNKQRASQNEDRLDKKESDGKAPMFENAWKRIDKAEIYDYNRR